MYNHSVEIKAKAYIKKSLNQTANQPISLQPVVRTPRSPMKREVHSSTCEIEEEDTYWKRHFEDSCPRKYAYESTCGQSERQKKTHTSHSPTKPKNCTSQQLSLAEQLQELPQVPTLHRSHSKSFGGIQHGNGEGNKNYYPLPRFIQPQQSLYTSSDDDLQCMESIIRQENLHLLQKRTAMDEKNQFQLPRQRVRQNEIDVKMELNNFEKQIPTLNNLSQRQSYSNFPTSKPTSNCLHKQNLTWKMRAQLVDWMMEVCYEYSFHRQTFHSAVLLLDAYFTHVPVPLSEAQLMGTAALLIAVKVEEGTGYSCDDMVCITDNAYSASQLVEGQRKMCKILQYRLHPSTLFEHLNRLLMEWDEYVVVQYGILGEKVILFKSNDEEAYEHYRQIVQLVDVLLFHPQTYVYDQKCVILSIMYLLLGKWTNIFTLSQIIHQMPFTCDYLLQPSQFHLQFRRFLQHLNYSLIDLQPTLQYCKKYFQLPITYLPPIISPLQQQTMQLEEYCSLQTYNKHSLQTVVEIE